MLYSNELGTHEKQKPQGIDSALRGDQVFSGSYWDEFALTELPKHHPSQVLILGAGHGACIRPILARFPEAQIHLIDRDANALENLKRIYSKHFPALRFTTAVADAEDLSLFHQQKYDTIWVDLYDDQGFAPFVFQSEFLQNCVSALTSEGQLAINIFSYPCAMSLYREDPRVTYLNSVLASFFDETYVFPHRRNFTWIGKKSVRTEEMPVTLRQDLSETDASILYSYAVRRRYATPLIRSQCLSFSKLEFSFASINRDWAKASQQKKVLCLAETFAELAARAARGERVNLQDYTLELGDAHNLAEQLPSEFCQWILPHFAALDASRQGHPVLKSFLELLC